MNVWVEPDAYDNPTLWTDGPTPDFPRALLVRVPSNADLFDWIATQAKVEALNEQATAYIASMIHAEQMKHRGIGGQADFGPSPATLRLAEEITTTVNAMLTDPRFRSGETDG